MDWAFYQPKKTGGGAFGPLPNLALSSQKTMKFGKGRNLYKLTTIFDDVIIMLILSRHQYETAEKIADFRGFWLNISKRVQLIFTKLMSVLGKNIQEFLKLKD